MKFTFCERFGSPFECICSKCQNQNMFMMFHAQIRYHWLKNGVTLKPSDRVIIEGGILTIINTNSKDTANYTCLAENGLDNDTAVAVLQVKGKIIFVSITACCFSFCVYTLCYYNNSKENL